MRARLHKNISHSLKERYSSIMQGLCLVLCLCFCTAQASAQDISGYWQGVLHISKSDTLTIGMMVEWQGDSLSVVMDSPDQYYMDIATTERDWHDSVLTWKVADIGASFSGRLSADGQRITGTFQQGGKLPLTFERGHERTVMRRPQTPQPPYPYLEEEIRIKEKGGRYNLINGTLTLPAGTPKALVILISGSGWQDRDESIMGHKPFRLLADHLTRHGYAVFRYDDYPRAVFAKSTTLDFADGVTMILDSFARREDLKHLPTGLLGHSEGSMVAEIVAAHDRRVDFVVTMGGVAQRPSDVLLYQLRAISEADSTLTPNEIENSVVLSARLYQALQKAKNEKEAAEILNHTWTQISERLTPDEQERYGFTPQRKAAAIQQLVSPWFFTFVQFDPKPYIKKMRCPVLAIGGEKDLQVDATANNTLFSKYLKKNPKHQFVIVPGANHLLQPCTTGSPNEYGKIEETMKTDVMDLITRWLENTL